MSNPRKPEYQALLNKVSSELEALTKSEESDELEKKEKMKKADDEKAKEAPEALKVDAPVVEDKAEAKADADPDTSAHVKVEHEADFKSMDDEALKAAYMAIKAEIFARMGKGAAPAPEVEKAVAGGMAPPAPALPIAGAGMAGGMGMAKSEDVDALKDQVASLEKSLNDQKAESDKIVKALQLAVTFPVQKAVTGFDRHLTKSEPTVDVSKLSKAEITQKLCKVTSSPDLQKSERDLINGYYAGSVSLEKISHLIK